MLPPLTAAAKQLRENCRCSPTCRCVAAACPTLGHAGQTVLELRAHDALVFGGFTSKQFP